MATSETQTSYFLQELRNNWKFPAVVYFCRVFEAVLNMSPFSSDLLEDALLSSHEHIIFISDIVTKLLTPGRKQTYTYSYTTYTPTTLTTTITTEENNVVAVAAWETSLQKKVTKNWTLTLEKDILEGRRFFDLTPSEKLDILHLLVEVALENSAIIRETIKNTVEDANLTADALRNSPIGEDANGSEYFLFSLRYEDCRVYKQSYSTNATTANNNTSSSNTSNTTSNTTSIISNINTTSDTNTDKDTNIDKLLKYGKYEEEKDSCCYEIENEDVSWHTVCTTLKEIEELTESFKDTKHKEEKKLYAYLLEVLPEFSKTEKKRKKAEERALKQEKVKRSDRIKAIAKRREAEKINKVKEEEMEDMATMAMTTTNVTDAMTFKPKLSEKHDNTGLSMGLSRAERAFYRNQRKELAKQGLRSVIAGKKRPLEYDGFTPLGTAITKMCQKRIQKVRPHRNMNKLTAIVWERFKRPVQHRAKFQASLDIYLKNNETEERVFVQTKKKEQIPLTSRILMPQLQYPKTLNVMNTNVLSKHLDKEDNDIHFEKRSVYQIPITPSLLNDQFSKVTPYNNNLLCASEMNHKVYNIFNHKNNIIPISHERHLTVHPITTPSSNRIYDNNLNQKPLMNNITFTRPMPVHTPDPSSLRYIETLPRTQTNHRIIAPSPHPTATIVPVCQLQPRSNDNSNGQPKHTILLQTLSPPPPLTAMRPNNTFYPFTSQRVAISPSTNNGNNGILMNHQPFPQRIFIPVSYATDNKGN